MEKPMNSDADRTARAPADPAGDNFGSAEHWKEKAQYWAAAAHRMRQEALRGEPVDGIVHPKADSVLEDAARLDWLALAGPVSICVVIDRPHDGEVEVATDDVTGYGKTLREAIDAAMKKGGAA